MVHEDFRGDMDGMMSLGKISVISSLIYQNINGKSSTEDDIIGMNYVMKNILWPKYFIEKNGYLV